MPTTDRIIDVTDGPVSLRYENSLIVFERKDVPPVSVPVRDIGVLMLSTPHVTLTQPVIAELSGEGVCVVFANKEHMPAAMCLPFGAHHQPAARFRQQADAKKPVLKRLWQEIVRSKLVHQAALLQYLHGQTYGLESYADQVFSGDTTNMEAQGAKLYWSKLFGDMPFARDREADDVNVLLNYGYTILRAITARAICTSGLHPGLGIHHHHRDNSFCLADDLMESFRTYVDLAVYRMIDGGKLRFQMLTKEGKAHIINQLLKPLHIDGRDEQLFYVVQRLAGSLVNVFGWDEDGLRLPRPCFK